MTDAAYRAKRELKNYRQLDKRIGEMYERIANLMDRATHTTPAAEGERVSTSGDRSRVEQTVITKVDLERQLDSMIDESRARRDAIQNAIQAMPDLRERRLLELRYIDGRSWVNVMMKMEISEPTSRRIHYSALESFYKSYIKESKRGE